MSPGAEITRLGVTDLDIEVPGRAQQRILGNINMADTQRYNI